MKIDTCYLCGGKGIHIIKTQHGQSIKPYKTECICKGEGKTVEHKGKLYPASYAKKLHYKSMLKVLEEFINVEISDIGNYESRDYREGLSDAYNLLLAKIKELEEK